MKTRITLKALTIIYLLGIQSSLSQNPTYEWSQQMGGPSYEKGESIAVDASGNIYTTGRFLETVDFDPGAGTINLTSAGDSDIFVQKLDANGNFIWAKQMGGTNADVGQSIVVDASGNIYTTGAFSKTVDFDPGTGTANLTSVGITDVFIQKLDANGNFIWAKQMGGTSYDIGKSIVVDASGNIYITGNFSRIVDFDPGAGTANLTSVGDSDIFVQKLDANGNFIWAKQMGGTSDDYGYSIAVDASGNIYTTGNFEGTADFDPGAGTTNFTSAGILDVFVQKLDANGNFLWAKQMGGTYFDYGRSIVLGASGNVYITGNFQETADFDPGAGTYNLTSAGGSDIFIQKLDANGNFLWAKQMGGTHYDEAHSIAVDASGNVYTTGNFSDTADFDPGAETHNLSSIGGSDIFILKLDADGNFLWSKQMGGASYDYGYSIAVDITGNVYTTGYFEATADFDPGLGTADFTSAGYYDIFVQKLSITKLGLSEYEHNVNPIVYPNPSADIFNIKFEKKLENVVLTINDIQGKLISTTKIKNSSKASIDLNVTPGIYLLTIKSKEGKKTIQLIKE